MSARRTAIALGVLLMAGAPLAEAQRGGGGSHGNGSHGGGSGGNGGHGQPSGGGTRHVTGAEARHPQGGSGHGYYSPHYGYGYPYYYGGYYGGYYPYYYGGYYPYYWGGYPYYGYGYGPYFGIGFSYNSGGGYDDGYYHSSYPDYRYRARETGSIRTLVDPENTKVYVDGHYAGEVDDFDGMFQRLYASPGRHDLTFKLDGYRTHRVKVYVTEDQTIKVRHNMVKGSGEETVSDMTEGREEPPYRVEREREPENDDERWVPREAEPRPRQPYESREGGGLRLDVHPDDATIYVDGQFHGPARRGGTLSLPAGRHHIEVVRPGFRTNERDVEVRPGKTDTVAIDLERN